MSDELSIAGKQYVSSRRASETSGYAQDYIGQLARSGQIDAQRMGGMWYVFMDSLTAYQAKSGDVKQENAPTPEPQTPTDVIVAFDGKEYISANRASKITGYNQDYVGQLARSGKVLSRQVGNRWYVDRESLLAHKEEKDALLSAVQAQSVGLPRAEAAAEPEAEAPASPEEEPLLVYHPQQEEDLMPIPTAPEEHIVAISVSRVPEESEDIEQEALSAQVPVPIVEPARQRVPITVIPPPRPAALSPLSPRRSAPLPARKAPADRQASRVLLRPPQKTGGMLPALALTAFAVLTFAFVGIRSGALGRFGTSSAAQGMTASVMSSGITARIGSVLTRIEDLLSPELVYKAK